MNCPFLHNMEYKERTYFYGMTNEVTIEGWFGSCKIKGCTFTRKVLGPLTSDRTASRMPPKGSPHPTKAGVPAATSAPAPPLEV